MPSYEECEESMYGTWFVNKPVCYSTKALNIFILSIIETHGIFGYLAFITGTIGMLSKKGQWWHINAGVVFCFCMFACAFLGVIGDSFRYAVEGIKIQPFHTHKHTHTHTKYKALGI